jgi:hypothetical protein
METLLITVAGVLLATVLIWLAREAWRYFRPVAPDVEVTVVQFLPPEVEAPSPDQVVSSTQLRVRNREQRDLHKVTLGVRLKDDVRTSVEGEIGRLRARHERLGVATVFFVPRSDDPGTSWSCSRGSVWAVAFGKRNFCCTFDVSSV